MKNPLVIIACPTSDHKKYCQDEWISWILGFSYPNFKILIVDNSDKEDNANEIRQKYPAVECVWIGNYVKDWNIRQKLAESTKIIKEMVLHDYKADYWLSIESDVFVPQNSIEYLLAYDKDVITIPYFHFDDIHLLQMQMHIINGAILIDYMPLEKSFANMRGGIVRVYQNGIGCMLISRRVLEKMPIQYEDTDFNAFPDYFIHLWLWQKKIPVWMDTTTYALHKNNSTNWRQIEQEFKV